MRDNLLHLSLINIKKFETNLLTSFVVQEKFKELKIIISDPNDSFQIFKEWEKILSKEEYDISQILYFLEVHGFISFYELGKIYGELHLDLTSKEYETYKRKDFFLLTYLTHNNLWEKFDQWDDFIWEK